MDNFLDWLYVFLWEVIGGIYEILKGLFTGLVRIFNIPQHIRTLLDMSPNFSILAWILAMLVLLVTAAVFALLIFGVVLLIRRRILIRRAIKKTEQLLVDFERINAEATRYRTERDRVMELCIGKQYVASEAINTVLNSHQYLTDGYGNPIVSGIAAVDTKAGETSTEKAKDVSVRFPRLTAVDVYYKTYMAPKYRMDQSLEDICKEFRNFACSKLNLYYELRTIRLMFAGLASTKLILLQGISGTGKTSLPYALGKYLQHDATIASVQPSWRDRTELFGYFNEFTKKYNETEFLRRVYEASYNDDINVIVLDEMNIARVEYYFAEMLSVLEMPNEEEWKIELVPSLWDNDPKHLVDGKLFIPPNVWYVGTANNDDSTFAVSDKVYDRALVINLDKKGIPFDAPDTDPANISYSYVDYLYKDAVFKNPLSEELLAKVGQLDAYVIEKFRVAFGNRIMKQLKVFVPVFVAAGGDDVEGVDYILTTKVFRKFEALNLSIVREEIPGLIDFLNRLFGKDRMTESIAYLERIERMF